MTNRATLGRRAVALDLLRGGRAERAFRTGPAVPISAIQAAPEWLCLPPAARRQLAIAMAAAAWAGGLATSIDGRALARLVDAVGPEAADAALINPAAVPLPLPADLPDAATTGAGLMVALLRADAQTAPLASLLGPVPELPVTVAEAAIGPALARLP